MATDLAPGSYVVVVGCGRLGGLLANHLSAQGHSLVVIDVLEEAFRNLSAEFSGFTILGDATHSAVLSQANVRQADVVIATTRDDNTNLMIVQVARTGFGVERVLARVFHPARTEMYRALDIETVCPTTVAAEILLRRLGVRIPPAEGGAA